MPSSESWYSSH